MSFLTRMAMSRRSVTILVAILILAAGLFTYQRLQREYLPEMEFPTIGVITIYPSANPDAVERDVTEPIEDEITGMTGLKDIRSVSSENASSILANFEFGTDMKEANRTVETNVNGISFPDGVEDPLVFRLSTSNRPVLSLSVIGDRDLVSLQRITDDFIVPPIERVEGVLRVDIFGQVDEQVVVTVDTDKLDDLGLTMLQVANAIRENNMTAPAGNIDEEGRTYLIRTNHEFGSLEDIRNLGIGFETTASGGLLVERPIYIRDIAEVELSTAESTSISRSNGKPGLVFQITKEADANTVDVANKVSEVLEEVKSESLPADVEIVTLSSDALFVEEQLNTLQSEGIIGFFIAVLVVFVFLVNLQPTWLRGLAFTLRPTAIVGLSIPLSVFGGILLIWLTDQLGAEISLNIMSLSGLAISVGRVVDDSIVALENIYRHIQRGEERMSAAVSATREVGGAIILSTLTTVAVFLPLAFIPGLVGEMFVPFALAASYTLVASTLVALTIVPVLGAVLLRRGDISQQDGQILGMVDRETWVQHLYVPVLRWALQHKLASILVSATTVAASLALLFIIPVTLFPSATPESMTIDVELPIGTSVGRTFEEVIKVEGVLADLERQGIVAGYQVTLGNGAVLFDIGGGGSGFNAASFFIALAEEVPEDIVANVRDRLPGDEETTIIVKAFETGTDNQLEINIIGNNFTDVSAVARRLEAELQQVEGVVNVSSDISEARDEVVIKIEPVEAAEFGLTTGSVSRQVNQFVVGEAVSEVDLEGLTMDIVVRGPPEYVDRIDKLKNLTIEGTRGQVKLGLISEIFLGQGPVSLSRFDNERSASITGDIIAEDTRAVSLQVEDLIETLRLPPGVEIRTGGVFEQLAEGFEDVFLAMLVGVALVYLIMVAGLGSLRNPLVIMISLPLALVGALVALALTGRTLSLPAMMGLLLLIGVVVDNAIVLITFVEQLRQQGMSVHDALVEGGRVRLRPILMTAFTTTFALVPLALTTSGEGGIIGAELATVVIGGMISDTVLTLIVVPVIYAVAHQSLPGFFSSVGPAMKRFLFTRPAAVGEK